MVAAITETITIQALQAELEMMKRRNIELESLLTVDELTGLTNRRGIIARMDAMIASMARGGQYVFCAFIDLDGFKEVNDSFGHEAGDSALKAVSQRLLSVMRPDDVVGRMGGDEFIVTGYLDTLVKANLKSLGNRIVEAIQKPFFIHDQLINLGASVGIVELSLPSMTNDVHASVLLRRADSLMYAVKMAGKNGCQVEIL
jgi:diguanylate cyclase (GGDEF)-like protein